MSISSCFEKQVTFIERVWLIITDRVLAEHISASVCYYKCCKVFCDSITSWCTSRKAKARGKFGTWMWRGWGEVEVEQGRWWAHWAWKGTGSAAQHILTPSQYDLPVQINSDDIADASPSWPSWSIAVEGVAYLRTMGQNVPLLQGDLQHPKKPVPRQCCCFTAR